VTWSVKRRSLLLYALIILILSTIIIYPLATKHTARQRTYRIGADNAPPYQVIHPDGSIDGLSVEIMNAAAQKAGLRLQWVPCHKTPDEELASGEVDLWPALAATPERLRLYKITAPWLMNDTMAVALASHQRLDDQLINSSKVAMRGKSSLVPNFQEEFPGAVLLRVQSREDALVSVCQGQADVGIVETRFMQSALLHRPQACWGKSLLTHTIRPLRAELSIVGRKDAGVAAFLLRNSINAVARSGQVDQSLERWNAYTSADGANLVDLEQAEFKNTVAISAICLILAVMALLGRQYVRVRRAERQALAAKLSAEAANSSKSAFLANMSHEIRTPMNGILGFADLALQSDSAEEQRECLATIISSGDALLAILNDVLDLSKIESGKFDILSEAFSLRALLTEAGKVFAFRFREKGLHFELSVNDGLPDWLMGDELRLRQILLNLLGNAVKFTEKGSIGLTATGQQDGDKVNVRLTVRDSGIGIPPEKQATIFEAFRQADDSTSKKYGGTGLGLSICVKLVDLMGGKIELESAAGVGSSFSVLLSLGIAKVEARSRTQAGEETGETFIEALRILLAEDNPVNQKLAVRLLEKQGHTVTLAGDGRRAVEAFTSGSFDMILMDVHMPEMDGLEATKQIRKLEKGGPRIPIIALTALAMAGDRETCLAAGMDGFVSKPIRLNELRSVMNAVRQPAALPLALVP
jgi:signal transduction histidine kinase/ActR/RegA family two-component response regulator